MKYFLQGAVIAAFGVAVGYAIAANTVEPEPAVVVEREVPVETFVEPDRIPSADLKLLVESMRPVLPEVQNGECHGGIPAHRMTDLQAVVCAGLHKANSANHAALSVLDKLIDNDLVDWDDGAYDDES